MAANEEHMAEYTETGGHIVPAKFTLGFGPS